MLFGFRIQNADIVLLHPGSSVRATDVMTPFIGQWMHVAVIFDGTTAGIYLNGEEVVSGPFFLANNTDAEMRIGSYNNDSPTYNGDLDEVRIYNRALTSAELAGN